MSMLKALMTQKTTWAGLALVVMGIGQIVTGEDTGQAIQRILEGLGLVFLRQAVAKQGTTA